MCGRVFYRKPGATELELSYAELIKKWMRETDVASH